MNIVVKVVCVKGDKSFEVFDSFGKVKIYPDGTERVVWKLTWKGFRKCVQVCKVKMDGTNESAICYNDWVEI